MKQNKDREELIELLTEYRSVKYGDIEYCGIKMNNILDWVEDYTQKKVEEREKCKLKMANSNGWWNNKLRQQREEIIKEIEGIVGEDEKGEFDQYWMANQLRKEIRERLKQINNLKEK